MSGITIWSDSGRVDCALSVEMNYIILQLGIVCLSFRSLGVVLIGHRVGGLTLLFAFASSSGWHSLPVSFKATVGYIEWSNSRRVDCVLCSMHTPWYYTGWYSLYISS